MILPKDTKGLTAKALDLVEACSISMGQRSAAYRQYGQWIETGRNSGSLSIANLLYGHLDRLASHIYSPTDLRFSIDFESHYEQIWLDRASVVARVLTREWERKNIDLLFGHGVKEALGFGAYFIKQLAGADANEHFKFRGARLVPPWAMGVYNESVNDLDDQEAVLETVYLTRSQVWQRVRHLPDAEKLFKRIIAASTKENGVGTPTSFMHQVLSTAVLNTSLQNMTQPQPGGIVQLSNDQNFATLGPQVAPQLFPMHELWVRDDARGGDDYTTIQLIEPDILVAPRLRHSNLFVKETLPYTLIQLNYVPGYLWGRSEVTDLMMLQDWFTSHLDDTKRLIGIQIDKILGFEGIDGLTDEIYGQMTRVPGTIAMPQGAKIQDLTPQMPPGMLEIGREIVSLMEKASGFPPIMSGSGEPGVRAGVHADTLMKTGSPRLRDRSLMAERQCASAADTTLACYEAKDARGYWTDPKVEMTDFLLSQLMEDRRVGVDAHSGSPIYHDDHANLIAWGVKSGIIDGRSAIEQLPFSHKDILIDRWQQAQAEKAAMIQKYGLEAVTGHPQGHRSQAA